MVCSGFVVGCELVCSGSYEVVCGGLYEPQKQGQMWASRNAERMAVTGDPRPVNLGELKSAV